MLAAQSGNVARVRALLRAGANIHACDADERTALMYAAAKGRTGVVRLLLRHSADVNAVAHVGGYNWRSVFSEAARGGHGSALRVLLSHIRTLADPPSDSYLLFRALTEAARRGHDSIVRLLRMDGVHVAGHGPWMLTQAAECGDIEEITLLLDLGVDIDAPKGILGRTPLITAVAEGQIRVVQILLERGADVNAPSRDGETALLNTEELSEHFPAHLGGIWQTAYERALSLRPAHIAIRQILLKHGAS